MSDIQTRDYFSIGQSSDGGSIEGTVSPTSTTPSEFALLREMLNEFGLGSIYDRVRSFITSESTGSEIELALREFPEVQQRFAAVFDAEQAGRPPVSFADVLAHEEGLSKLASYYGLPVEPGENLQDMARQQLNGEVSLSEAQDRMAAQQAFGRAVLDDPDMDPDVIGELLGRGVTPMDVANFVLDPSKTLEQVERRLAAAAVANEASQANYRLTSDEALELSRRGVTGEQAQQGFGVLRQNSQVVDRLIGDSSDPVTREQELAALSGDVQAQAAIELSAQKRVAAFSAGGSFVTDDEGFGGLR